MAIYVTHAPDCRSTTKHRPTNTESYACNCHMKVISALTAERDELTEKARESNQSYLRRAEQAEQKVATMQAVVDAANWLVEVWEDKGHGGVKETGAHVAIYHAVKALAED
jgi:hypothetical protein